MPSYVRTILKSKNIVNIALETRGLDFREISPFPEGADIKFEISSNKEVSELEEDHYFNNNSLAMHKKTLRKTLIDDGKINKDRFENYVQALKNYLLTGHPSWYSWNKENWGTKWNSMEFEYKDGAISFQTAWYHPFIIVKKLSMKFPKELITVKYADEFPAEKFGYYNIKNGTMEAIEVEDGIQFSREVWNLPNERMEEVRKEG